MNKNCILLEIKLHFVFSDNFYQVFFLKDLNTACQKNANIVHKFTATQQYIYISYLFCPF